MSTINLALKLRSYHPYYISKFITIIKTEMSWNAELQEVFLPRKVERFTVLRSPHVDKKARDQFERVIHQRLLILKNIEVDFKNIKNLLVFFRSIALGVEVTVQTKNNV